MRRQDEVAGAVALAAAALGLSVAQSLGDWGQLPTPLPLVLLSLVAWLPLLAIRRAPLLALGAGTLDTALVANVLHVEARPYDDLVVLHLFVVIIAAGGVTAARGLVWGLGGLAVAGGVLLWHELLQPSLEPWTALETVVGAVVFGNPIVVGAWVRRRRRLADRRARQLVSDERARIARELHDVVARHVSSIVIQAGAAQSVADRDPGAAAIALEQVRVTGAEALESMRRLLGILRASGDGPVRAGAASLERIELLIDGFREVGMAVTLVVRGAPRSLAPDLDLNAHRILEEALTNALKHAPDAPVRVTVQYHPEAVELRVDDDGARGARRDGVPPGGHGLVGMRERVALFAGQVAAGPRPDGGWSVTARLAG